MLSFKINERSYLSNTSPIVNALREHHLLVKSEFKTQHDLVERMWVLAQRYTILSSNVTPSKLAHLIETSTNIEDEIRTEFLSKLNQLCLSNLAIQTSLSKAKEAFASLLKSFDGNSTNTNYFKDPDKSVEPSIAFFCEHFADVLKYFNLVISKLNSFVIILTPDSVSSLERYKQILKLNSDFEEYFSKFLATCKCLEGIKKSK